MRYASAFRSGSIRLIQPLRQARSRRLTTAAKPDTGFNLGAGGIDRGIRVLIAPSQRTAITNEIPHPSWTTMTFASQIPVVPTKEATVHTNDVPALASTGIGHAAWAIVAHLTQQPWPVGLIDFDGCCTAT